MQEPVKVSFEDVVIQVIRALATQLDVDPKSIDSQSSIRHLGFSSLEALRFVGYIEDALDVSLDLTVVYEFPIVESLARHLFEMMSGSAGADPATAAERVDGPLAAY